MPSFSSGAQKVSALGAIGLCLVLIAPLIGCSGKSTGNAPQVIAAGDAFSLVIIDGKVYAAGWNEYGQLGLGDESDRNRFTEVKDLEGKKVIAIYAGTGHSFALSKDGKVYAAGWNNKGQLGLGDSGEGNHRSVFTEVTDLSGKNITAITAGIWYSLALAKDGKVYATGDNRFGQLSLGDENNRDRFTEVTSLNGKNIVAIAAGYNHSLALAKDGKVYTAGNNVGDALFLGEETVRDRFTEVTSLNGKNIVAIAAGRYHSLALSKEGKVYAAGYNEYLSPIFHDDSAAGLFVEIADLSGKGIIAIATGSSYSLALAKDGKVYATENKFFNKPDASVGKLDIFIETKDLSGKNVVAVATGYYSHSLALAKDGKVYAMGDNFAGELGLGDNDERDSFTLVPIK
jgi:alpha-tubulin suppressor-like RCC1 family protein